MTRHTRTLSSASFLSNKFLFLKPLYCSILILSSLTLHACGGKDEEKLAVPENSAATQVVFNPVLQKIPFANDLIFADTTDGTAQVDVSDSSITPALNDLDGWSTTAQLDFEFTGEVDEASLCTFYAYSLGECAAPNVFLVPLATTGDALDFADINSAAPFPTEPTGYPQYRANVVTLESDKSYVRISPLKPLNSATKYLVILTNGILDTDEAPVGPSDSYLLLVNDFSVPNSLTDLRDLLLSLEALSNGFFQANSLEIESDNIVLAHTFTTTNPTAVLTSMAAPSTFNPALASPSLASLLPTPKARPALFYKQTAIGPGEAGLFGEPADGGLFSAFSIMSEGAIQLPYYLNAPALGASIEDATTAISGTQWTPDQTLGAALSSALGVTLPPADEDKDEDGVITNSYNVTYRYPFPTQTTTETIPIISVYPNEAETGLTKPVNGWPVVLFNHGIVNDRSAGLILANALSNICLATGVPSGTDCFATLLIDQPLHGNPAKGPIFSVIDNVDQDTITGLTGSFVNLRERHFGFTQVISGSGGASVGPMVYNADPTLAVGTSGSLFVNLANFMNSRDHLRQGVVDYMNLAASIATLDIDGDASNGPDLDPTRVYMIGHSMGGINGIPAVAVINSEAVQTANGISNGGNLPFIRAAAFLNTGGHAAKLLENSPSTLFGASAILRGLAINSLDEDSGEYLLKQGSSNLEKYFYSIQSHLDHSDPINFIPLLADTNTGLYFSEMIGDGTAGSSDQTIKNGADDNPSPYLASADNPTAPLKHVLAGRCPLSGANLPDGVTNCTTDAGILGVTTVPELPDITALSAPLAGTEPLIKIANAESIIPGDTLVGAAAALTVADPDDVDAEAITVVARFTDGGHETPIVPVDPSLVDVFQDIVVHVATLFSSNGKAIAVANTSNDLSDFEVPEE
ncbi:MAG: hypothetical protein V4629_11770 [Pseudomonadota bacterium]